MTIVFGDIHGGLRGLQQLLKIVDPNPTDRLIFLGDYVDGWSESAQVVDFLINLNTTHDCIFINGNHDDWCRNWLMGKGIEKTWHEHGGKATISSYSGYSEIELEQHRGFFDALQDYFIDEENRLFIHAGFTAMHGVKKERNKSTFSYDRTLWEVARTMDEDIKPHSPYYPKRLLNYKEIFIGHTPSTYFDSLEPMNGCNVWNLDTGAAFTGPLTAMDADTKQYWQSESLYALYPGEKGRN